MNLTLEEGKKFEEYLSSKGYKRHNEHHKHEDYVYWRSFNCEVDADGDRIKGYSVGFGFYDFSKYPSHTDESSKIGISLECRITDHGGIDRVDMTITDSNTTVEEFELICKNFYEFFIEMHRLKTARNN